MKSQDQQILILVDKKDNPLGFKERKECHQGKGVKHRAFMTFLINKKSQLLLTQRSTFKKLWPGFWDASVVSHVLKGEDYKKAAVRRSKEELNLKINEGELKSIGGFSYQSEYENSGSENEYCQVFVAKLNKPIKINEEEISKMEYVGQRELTSELSKPTEKFTPWFKIAFRLYLGRASKFK